ncbi:MarR family winged helix-turn-helix transcriptional regulator [Rhizobium mongolense]|uniref:MarR family winged helix-turn-helix transcriptional regulator n=1 Tax=Rhizobium mongolense TaxID=57676 RepID=UPI0034A5062D
MDEKTEGFESWAYCSNSALRRATRQLGQLYDDVLAPSGLKATQYGLLSQIHFNGNPSLKSLADGLVMDLSALGQTLKPLIRDGLLELVPDEKDRRVKRAGLTEIGVEKWQEAHLLWREAHSRFDNAFGEEESAALRNAMNRIASPDFAKTFVADPAKGGGSAP